MANSERYNREEQDTKQFWQTVHQHVAACLRELGEHAGGWQVHDQEYQIATWLVDLHVYTHVNDEDRGRYELPQCDEIPGQARFIIGGQAEQERAR